MRDQIPFIDTDRRMWDLDLFSPIGVEGNDPDEGALAGDYAPIRASESCPGSDDQP